MKCVFSSLFRPITKLMWIPACNETNLQADTQWKGKGIRETNLLINGFKLKTTKSSSCRSAVCFNDCGMGPDVGLSSFSLSNVLGKFIVNYRGLLQGYISLGRAIPRHQPLNHIVAWQQVNQCRDDLQTSFFDINWCLITLIIYVQTLKRLLGELTRGYDTSI